MRKGIYYHFLESKEKELENNRLHSLDFRLNESEVVEQNNCCPQLLHLFPWEIRKVITPHDLEFHEGLELNARQVNEHLLIHWDSEMKQSVVNGEQIPIQMLDWDTKTEYQMLFKKWPNCERYMVHGFPFEELVTGRNLTAGMTIGMYWDIKSKVLRFSILDNS
ncbi:hypothetical protein ACH5RR_032705 [Cinchona calisaya]|uniref:Uncharacterized protein n=1 Tax=Cinchona calisaya TaxID=153742 RepID=A0ABD2YK04_9GENT